jgi:predicted amidohydrolase
VGLIWPGPTRIIKSTHEKPPYLIQGETRWHDPAGNRNYYADLIEPLHNTTDLVILPETFTSGFSNDAISDAETMDGPTVEWLRRQAGNIDAAICGSVQIRDGEGVCNRAAGASGGLHTTWRHLFRYAGERALRRGPRPHHGEWKGWRICPQVCYDRASCSPQPLNVERGLPITTC